MQPPEDLDPRTRYRSELPELPKERMPIGYQAGLQLGDRLQGLGVIVLGFIGLAVVYGTLTGVLPAGLPAPPQPPGLLVRVPIVNPVACFMPLMAIGSVALIVVGFRRVIDP